MKNTVWVITNNSLFYFLPFFFFFFCFIEQIIGLILVHRTPIEKEKIDKQLHKKI